MVTGREKWVNVRPLRLSAGRTFTLHPTIHSDSAAEASLEYRGRVGGWGGGGPRNANLVFLGGKTWTGERWRFKNKPSDEVLPPLTETQWSKRSREPPRTQAGLPPSPDRPISSQLLPASFPFVLPPPSLPHCSPLLLPLQPPCAWKGALPCVCRPGSLSCTLYVGRRPDSQPHGLR